MICARCVTPIERLVAELLSIYCPSPAVPITPGVATTILSLLPRQIDNDAAAHLALQDARRQRRHISQRHGLGHPFELSERQIAREAIPGLDALLARAQDRVDAEQIDPAQQERDHAGRQVATAGEPAGGDAGAVFELCQ